MTLKSDAKFEDTLTLGSKIDMKNLVNFNASSDKSENLRFEVLVLSKEYLLCREKLQNDAKFEEGWLMCWKMTWGI